MIFFSPSNGISFCQALGILLSVMLLNNVHYLHRVIISIIRIFTVISSDVRQCQVNLNHTVVGKSARRELTYEKLVE